MKSKSDAKVSRKTAKAPKARVTSETKTKAKATRTRKSMPKPALKIPPILLEGDESPLPSLSGPGERFVLGPGAGVAVPVVAESGELPEAYGTKRLLLAARDPHWLYAHWDLTQAQLKRYNALSQDGHLVLRVYKDALQGNPFSELHLHPEARNWFAHVGLGGARFLAELGYYQRPGKWTRISVSRPTLTPTDTMSEDTSAIFETMPADVPLRQVLHLVQSAIRTNDPLMKAVQEYRAAGHGGLPEPERLAEQPWTPEQEQALARLVTMDTVRRVWVGSLEITELVRRQLLQAISSAGAAQFGQPALWSGAISSVSSPYGGAEVPKSFWFNVNAELIIYGATEPSAQVSIGGRAIRLRPDGTFSYRFALPDGKYELPAVAVAADGSDRRVAALSFQRSTEYQGTVGRHPQDPKLKPPHPDSLTTT